MSSNYDYKLRNLSRKIKNYYEEKKFSYEYYLTSGYWLFEIKANIK